MTARSTTTALVMFGLTGDLGRKKLFPAIVELARAGRLDGPVVGVGRSQLDDDELWQMLHDAVDDDVADLRDVLDLRYLRGDSQEPSTYDELSKMLGNDVAPVVYAALPPVLFGGVARGIADALPAATRLVVEKPFGHDVASAVALHDEITSLMPASQVFAVDHFLAKAEVEHLAPFRYRNPLIDAAFDQSSVDRIEVIMAEAFGVDGRGSFYESVGALRDVVQNHLLQMIAVVLMEAPADDSAKAFDRARANLLADMRPLTPADVVLGQFDGYRDLDDVADDSIVETFVAARLAVDNTRWRGVPITLRTGKELADSVTSIEIHLGENTVRFGIKPERIVVLRLDVDGERTDLVACAPTGHPADEAGDHRGAKRGEVILGDYATMLAGAIDGDQRHFAQIADIVRAWEIVEGVLDSGARPESYEPGSWGPPSARALLDESAS
ncbi:MAG: hypothetical protein R2733_23745 [Acidimicrobiales bacterium]